MRSRRFRPSSAPLLPKQPGQAKRRTFDYRRHGTTSLFAALDVKAGTVIGELHRRHQSVVFEKFLKRIDAETPAGLDIHLILDDYSTHKSPARAGPAPEVPSAFPSDLQLVTESGGAMVRGADDPATASPRASQHSGPRAGDSGVSRPAQRHRQPVRVDEIAEELLARIRSMPRASPATSRRLAHQLAGPRLEPTSRCALLFAAIPRPPSPSRPCPAPSVAPPVSGRDPSP